MEGVKSSPLGDSFSVVFSPQSHKATRRHKDINRLRFEKEKPQVAESATGGLRGKPAAKQRDFSPPLAGSSTLVVTGSHAYGRQAIALQRRVNLQAMEYSLTQFPVAVRNRS